MVQQEMAAAVTTEKELVTKYETSFEELNPQIKRVAKQAAALVGR